MRLVFDETGTLRAYHKITPPDDGPGAPWVVIDAEFPAYFTEGVYRACETGRVSYSGGQVLLDGQPYTPPTLRPDATYGQALAAVAGATSIAQLRAILYRVCDQFLGVGALEL